MNWLRYTSYKDLLEGMFLLGFFLAFISGGALIIIVFPVGLLLFTLKIGIDVYDSAQERIGNLLKKQSNKDTSDVLIQNLPFPSASVKTTRKRRIFGMEIWQVVVIGGMFFIMVLIIVFAVLIFTAR